MNFASEMQALLAAAGRIGAEKVLLSIQDVSGSGIRTAPCDDAFVLRAYPLDAAGLEVEEPMCYATDAVASGWAVFVAGGSVNFKRLSDLTPSGQE